MRVAAAGHGEALVEAADLLDEGAGCEQAVALPQPVEPVTITGEVADLEEAVAVVRPLDLVEQRILDGLVVAGPHHVPLLAGAHVPGLRGDDGRLVGLQARQPVVEDPWCEHMGAVDHESERGASALGQPPVHGRCG